MPCFAKNDDQLNENFVRTFLVRIGYVGLSMTKNTGDDSCVQKARWYVLAVRADIADKVGTSKVEEEVFRAKLHLVRPYTIESAGIIKQKWSTGGGKQRLVSHCAPGKCQTSPPG